MTTDNTQADNRVYISADGFERMKEELEELRNIRRPEVAELIQRAKELGDITDSAQYDAAKNEQAFLEGRIRHLEDNIRRALIIEEQGPEGDGAVRVGSTVLVRDGDGEEERWTIVGRAEADASHGRISNESPVGGALLGKRAGETLEIATPAGALTFTISSVE